jgi:hypothetical protein
LPDRGRGSEQALLKREIFFHFGQEGPLSQRDVLLDMLAAVARKDYDDKRQRQAVPL